MATAEELAERVIGEAQAEGYVPNDEGPVKLPKITPPPSGLFTLPGGYIPDALEPDKVVYEVEVAELTGLAEERIEKARRTNRLDRFFNAIIVNGTVRIGGEDATEDILDGLLIGDRDALLVEIRRATYGSDVEFGEMRCPECSEEMDVTISLDDIPTRSLESSRQRIFDVKLWRSGHVSVRLPTGADQDFVFSQDAETGSAVDSLMLARCVLSVTDEKGEETGVAGNLSWVKNLSLKDRRAILKEITDRQPGPRYDEVTFTHKACETEVPFALSIGDLFPGL